MASHVLLSIWAIRIIGVVGTRKSLERMPSSLPPSTFVCATALTLDVGPLVEVQITAAHLITSCVECRLDLMGRL
uniref:Secreted protein n=1 Tax=Timema genevievae TaxID=629358 RepID=A0A7R9JRU3_TIMGE|nr:unnamed protein product [Timema genevievae]